MVQIIFLSNFLCDLAVTAKIKQQLSVSLKRVSLAGLFFCSQSVACSINICYGSKVALLPKMFAAR